MKECDLKVGKCYVTNAYKGTKKDYLFCYEGKRYTPYICISDNSYHHEGSLVTSINSNFQEYREATPDEEICMLKSINSSKLYIKPKSSEINNNYLLF